MVDPSTTARAVERSVVRLLRQQASLAAFGSFAFRQTDLLAILNEAARVCAEGIGVGHAKICRYRPEEEDLLIVAGFGWHEGIVGQVVSQADESSPQGRAFVTGAPVICHDVEGNNSFVLPAFYSEHKIVSTVDVIVKSREGPPFGILEIDSVTPQSYDEHDVNFLTGFANVLAEAVATASRAEVLRQTVAQMRVLVAEKDQLLAEKGVLAQELQHRVRNNLQLVNGMLDEQLQLTADEPSKAGLRGILRRVATLSQVYDQLLGVGLSRTLDFSEYARLLCIGLPEMQGSTAERIRLTCTVEPMELDLGATTALGLALTELVANSYEHAFPSGSGTIAITGGPIGGPAGAPGWGVVSVSDDGVGYATTGQSKRHGLGLVRRLMEQVFGRIEVRVTHGTTWVLTFPLFTGEEKATELPSPAQ
ncbi:MAG TPA: histidine kinase dimerization/phosphoacceptor domain -containing protein [Steroidobacteraceae bacterium]|nr:histidine kinase dimerization/phosphoacceptor domain -containing protein [Steroidobacteraceae bacterium]